MENNYSEYNCWLQQHSCDKLSNITKQKLSKIVCLEKGEIINNAVLEFQNGTARLGIKSKIITNPDNQYTLLGTSNKLKEFIFNKSESFAIYNTENILIVAGADERGLLYGIYHLIMKLQLEDLQPNEKIIEEPTSSIRMLNHWDNIDGSIERGYAGKSIFFNNNKIEYDKKRIIDYARLLASIGINVLSINNVNVHKIETNLITEQQLPNLSKLSDIFRPFGIRLLISINYASPILIGKLDTADPFDKRVQNWWKERCDLIYKYIPDLYGFLVKADSENEPGPFQYGRNHADGANMLAKAIKNYNGLIIWRCFVYNCYQDWRDCSQDRAKAAFDNFMPYDGKFDNNVILQIKNGPYDFQVKEPVSPLFGAMKYTNQAIEFQITQEYTGQQKDLCFLVPMWKDILNFDTKYFENSKISDLFNKNIIGISAVNNIGNDKNWTGHTLAQANLYGYGRLAWNVNLSSAQIVDEWVKLSFGDNPRIIKTVTDILLNSYSTFKKYNAPFGICFMVNPGYHYGPNVEGYEFSQWGTYHKANIDAIGIDRTDKGTKYTAQYSIENAKMYNDINTCPEDLLLFFHRIPYNYKMKNGKTLLQNIYNMHFEGVIEVEQMIKKWQTLVDLLPNSVYQSVLERFNMQIQNAIEWRDVINTYFYRRTGIKDEKGRKIYD